MIIKKGRNQLRKVLVHIIMPVLTSCYPAHFIIHVPTFSMKCSEVTFFSAKLKRGERTKKRTWSSWGQSHYWVPRAGSRNCCRLCSVLIYWQGETERRDTTCDREIAKRERERQVETVRRHNVILPENWDKQNCQIQTSQLSTSRHILSQLSVSIIPRA